MEIANTTHELMQEILHNFNISALPEAIVPFGSGHINDTYRVVNAGGEDYLLQRINHQIFTDVQGMMGNIEAITAHIDQQISAQMITDFETVKIYKSSAGSSYVLHKGGYWRLGEFKGHLHSYDLVENTTQAFAGGQAFGRFFSLLSDFPAERLTETLPNFHNIILRLESLKAATLNGIADRIIQVKSSLDFIWKHAEAMSKIERAKQAGVLPIRVTHNDTKFNNVLLNAQDQGVCVVDLDTVMPGLIHYDFGDGIRTATATANEDETDLSLVSFDPEKYRAFEEGYRSFAAPYLTEEEEKLLPYAGPLLAYIMGVRFLTDYISGDVYYKIKHEEHNLERAKNQLKLCNELMKFCV